MPDKKTVLFGITDEEEKTFMAHIYDLFVKSVKTHNVMYSRFLTPRQQLMCKERVSPFCDIRFFGGYDGAERVIASFVPEDYLFPEYPMSAIKAEVKSTRALCHRDYLGSVLSLGISRELIGDIITEDNKATIIVCNEISDFLLMNLNAVGKSPAKLTLLKDMGYIEGTRKVTEVSRTVSSMRLDAVIASAFNLSRTECASIIEQGIVNVNYSVQKKVSNPIKDGDVISARGYGKFQISTDMRLTKKGRIHISIKKYGG